MEWINFIKINEACEEYLKEHTNNLYMQLTTMYAVKAMQLEKCSSLEIKNKEEKEIDLLAGLDLICEYLNELNPSLKEEFQNQVRNGQIEINYTDEDVWLEEKTKGNWCKNHHPENDIVEEQNEVKHHTRPYSLIDIDNKKTTYSLLATMVHEFFHTPIVKDKNGNIKTNIAEALSEMISIYYEFNFVKKMIEKGIDKSFFLTVYTKRYENTTEKKELEFFLDQTAFLYKKMTEEVLDESSYKIGTVTCRKEAYLDLCKNASSFLEREEKKEEKAPLFNAHTFAPYILGAPLAYHLSCRTDPNMPQKMLGFIEEINSLPLSLSLSIIDLSLSKIDHLNYTNIMENMKEEIMGIKKHQSTEKKKSFTKI